MVKIWKIDWQESTPLVETWVVLLSQVFKFILNNQFSHHSPTPFSLNFLHHPPPTCSHIPQSSLSPIPTALTILTFIILLQSLHLITHTLVETWEQFWMPTRRVNPSTCTLAVVQVPTPCILVILFLLCLPSKFSHTHPSLPSPRQSLKIPIPCLPPLAFFHLVEVFLIFSFQVPARCI